MKQRLDINQVNFNDPSFMKENHDILPEAYTWFENIIQNGVKKEDQDKFPNFWFLFDKRGNYLLNYNQTTQNVYLSPEYIRYAFKAKFKFSMEDINHLCVPILKDHFNCHVNIIDTVSYYTPTLVELYFNIKIKYKKRNNA